MDPVSPGSATSIEDAADHFAQAAGQCDAKVRFVAAASELVADVESELPLGPDLVRWYRHLAPATTIYVRQLGNDLRVNNPHDLVEAQIGYRWLGLPRGRRGHRISDWPDAWVVIADIGADPVIANTALPGTPISYCMHGMGEWTPHLLAPSLAAYLEALARWIESCLRHAPAPWMSGWEDSIWDAHGHYLPK